MKLLIALCVNKLFTSLELYVFLAILKATRLSIFFNNLSDRHYLKLSSNLGSISVLYRYIIVDAFLKPKITFLMKPNIFKHLLTTVFSCSLKDKDESMITQS